MIGSIGSYRVGKVHSWAAYMVHLGRCGLWLGTGWLSEGTERVEMVRELAISESKE